MKTKRRVKLGQQVFVISTTGDIVRTMVGEINNDGSYSLLNGDRSYNPHWFTFKKAREEVQRLLESRKEILRKQITDIRQKSKLLDTDESMQAVMKSPYKVINMQDEFSHRARTLKKVIVPLIYPEPGAMMYLIIRPHTRPERDVYRPFPLFVLETKIKSVSFSPDGKVHPVFETPFKTDECFGSQKEAELVLRSSSELSTLEHIHFVSHTKEQKELEKFEIEIPF